MDKAYEGDETRQRVVDLGMTRVVAPDAASGRMRPQSGALGANEREELIVLRRTLRQVQIERAIFAEAKTRFGPVTSTSRPTPCRGCRVVRNPRRWHSALACPPPHNLERKYQTKVHHR